MNRHKFSSGQKIVHLKFESKVDTEMAVRDYLNSLPAKERDEIVKKMLQAMGVKNPRSEREILETEILRTTFPEAFKAAEDLED